MAVVRAGIYARISSDREGDNLAVGRQLKDCERLAKRKDWAIQEKYVDSDTSAYRGKHRPQYRRMLEDIESGHITGVVVYHADRLHRHPRELEDFIDLCQRMGVQLATVSGDVDLSTHEGQLIARIQGAVARKESDDKSRRISRKHEELAEEGKPSGGGSRPFGYEDDKVTVREDEAAVIRELADRVLAGDSLKSLERDLRARGVKTAQGKEWTTQGIRNLLLLARISGQREHKGEIVADAVWPPIISKAKGEKVRAKLRDPDRRTNRAGRRYLLTRLLRCTHCGSRLQSRPRADHVRRYVCSKQVGGCGRLTVRADEVELYVSAMVVHRLSSPLLPKAITRAPDDAAGAEWQKEADQAQAQLDELAAMWGAGEVTRGEWQKARAPIERRLDAARKKLAQANRQTAILPFIGDAKRVKEEWPHMTLSRQAEIVRAVVEQVTVLPGRRGYNRFDPDRLEVVWRA
jgi:DNA invertase Pin-like site-specific DNA recombinase